MSNHSEELIHKHHYNPFKSWHTYALLIPAIVFAFTLAFFNKDSYIKTSAVQMAVATPKPILEVKIGEKVIEVTRSEDEYTRRIGLSKHESLDDDKGMLFVFDSRDVKPIFWMKDMKIAIDIIWIDDGVVVQIDENAQPEPEVEDFNDLKRYLANQPVDYVLEVTSGFSVENNIEVGSQFSIENF